MELECPYCENQVQICHDDGFGYEEGVKHQIECEHCNKNFIFETSIIYHFEPEKADCLNGGEHNYQKTITFPKEFSRMRCTSCGDERELTEEERKAFGIDTKKSYFEKLNPKHYGI